MTRLICFLIFNKCFVTNLIQFKVYPVAKVLKYFSMSLLVIYSVPVCADLVVLCKHGLVQFKVDGFTSIVPARKIVNFNELQDGEDCEVLWKKRKHMQFL